MFFIVFAPSIFRRGVIYGRICGQWLIEIAPHQLYELREPDGLTIASHHASASLHRRQGLIASNDFPAFGIIGDRKLALREAHHRVAVRNLVLGGEEKKDFFVARDLWRAGVSHGEGNSPIGVNAAGQHDLERFRGAHIVLDRLRDRDRRQRNQAAIDPLASGPEAFARNDQRRSLRHLTHCHPIDHRRRLRIVWLHAHEVNGLCRPESCNDENDQKNAAQGKQLLLHFFLLCCELWRLANACTGLWARVVYSPLVSCADEDTKRAIKLIALLVTHLLTDLG